MTTLARHTPLSPNQLDRLHDAVVRLVRGWRQQRELARTRHSLATLDDAALRDLGLSRGEIRSVAGELHGVVEAQRRVTRR